MVSLQDSKLPINMISGVIFLSGSNINMKERNKHECNKKNAYRSIAICLILLFLLMVPVCKLYSKQWNWHGISKIPNVECKDSFSLEAVGTVNGLKVYQCGISNISYQTFFAKTIDIKDYCDKEWLSEKLLTERGMHVFRENYDVYQFENFYILIDESAMVFCNNDYSPIEVAKALDE